MSDEKKIFITRFVLFTLFACVLPFVFIAYRYSIFTKADRMSLSGWGLVAVLIIFFFMRYLLHQIKKGLPYSMFTQCLTGLMKVTLPLVILWLIAYALRNSIDVFLQSLIVAIVCETIAIPLNPMPKWVEENCKEKTDSYIETFIDKFFEKKNKDEGGKQ